MRSEADKEKVEIQVFKDFAAASGLNICLKSIIKGDPNIGQPDISCKLNEQLVHFELTEACAPEFAKAITESGKSGDVVAVWGEDVSEKTILKKISNEYEVSEPVDLLLYTAGRTALPDEVIIARIDPILANGLGPFRRVWFMGDSCKCIASNS